MSTLYISEQGSALRKQGGRYVLTKNDQELISIPQAAVDCVVVFGRVQVTTQAVQELLSEGVPLIYATYSGRFQGMLQPGMPKNIFIRLAQYDASLDEHYVLDVAKSIVSAKLEAASATISAWQAAGYFPEPVNQTELLSCLSAVDESEDPIDAMMLEARAARAYFDLLGAALPPQFAWQGRHRQPPPDPVNALLSLSYMMLTSVIIRECYACGLDPFIGFLHQHEYGRPSLALDLLEPFRPRCADRLVMRLLHSETFNTDDFVFSETNGCRLGQDGFREYLKEYEKFMTIPNAKNKTPTRAISNLLREFVRALRERRIPEWEVFKQEAS